MTRVTGVRWLLDKRFFCNILEKQRNKSNCSFPGTRSLSQVLFIKPEARAGAHSKIQQSNKSRNFLPKFGALTITGYKKKKNELQCSHSAFFIQKLFRLRHNRLIKISPVFHTEVLDIFSMSFSKLLGKFYIIYFAKGGWERVGGVL